MPRGGKIGNKGGGRKPLVIEAQTIFNMALANRLHNEALELALNTPVDQRKHEDIKDFVVPMTSRAVKTESTITLKTPKPLDDMSDIVANIEQKK